MAAGTIHEIRNPLTSISGFVQLLKARVSRQNDQTSIDYCRLITEEIVHINNILSDFLTLAKPQENKFEKVNIVQLVYDVLTLMYGEALLFQIALIPRLPDMPLYFTGNPEKIKEVLINIARNAFQAMTPGGTLTIGVTADNANIYIDVIDTGHGMSDSVIADIFKPFFTTKQAGTGLGLAICHRIIREHQGEIKVFSQINKGTTFTLILPRVHEDAI
jgi:signal transduction histidine kinase